MTKYYAVGTLVAWNALSASRKTFYDNNHFLSPDSARNALPIPSLITEDYVFDFISDYTNVIQHNTVVDMNGYKITYRGNRFRWMSNYNGSYDLYITVSNGKVEIQDFVFLSTIDKAFDSYSFIIIYTGSDGDITIKNNTFDINGKLSNGVFCFAHISGVVDIYNNLFKNSSNLSEYGGVKHYAGANGTYNINSNIFYNVVVAIRNSLANMELSNNYCSASSICIQGSASLVGGNATSDATGDIINIDPDDAFVDPVNDDFTPKLIMRQGVAPIIDGHTHYKNGVLIRPPYYIGAIGINSGHGFSRRNVMLYKNGIF